eukprot:6381484-Amphidinium_carterae.1
MDNTGECCVDDIIGMDFREVFMDIVEALMGIDIGEALMGIDIGEALMGIDIREVLMSIDITGKRCVEDAFGKDIGELLTDNIGESRRDDVSGEDIGEVLTNGVGWFRRELNCVLVVLLLSGCSLPNNNA